jgi:hypothetical protein
VNRNLTAVVAISNWLAPSEIVVKQRDDARSVFRVKAAQLRLSATTFNHPELKQGMLDLADHWDDLCDKIEADGTRKVMRAI